MGAVLAWFAYDLPDITRIDTQLRSPGLTVHARDGTVLGTYGEVHAGAVSADALPQTLIDAVIATEDRRFYDHLGVDLRGLMRAMWVNARAGRVVQGGSTLTQQLAKNLFLDSRKHYRRKIQELLLAFWLEYRFSKPEILTIYLNRVYFGAGSYGVEAAARRYFGRSTQDLTLAQSAMIAGLLKAPSRYAPTRNPGRAAQRAAVVLDNMVQVGVITPAEAARAKAAPAKPVGSFGGGDALYFTDWAMGHVPGLVGPDAGDLTLSTTVDPALQRLASSIVEEHLAVEGNAKKAGQAAMLVMSTDGAIRAMVGGRRYTDSQFNRATQARRQPGSAFKLFVYIAALESGIGSGSSVADTPVTVDGWQPRNYANQYLGTVTVTRAFAASSNAAAVRLAESVGRDKVISTARRLGIESVLADHPSLALGASEVTLLELTSAYAVIANGGAPVLPFGLAAITNRDGAEIFRRRPGELPRILDPGIARAMDGLLRAVVDDGTGKAARLSIPAAGKTGTSQDFRDAWFVGYAGGLVVGVWTGNDDATPMDRVTGGGLPARIWRDFMTAATALPQP